jgi:putative intracellular protease/amidase
MTDILDADRRKLMQLLALGAALGGAGLPGARALAADAPPPGAPRPKVAMVVHPRMVLLDLIGPATVLNICQCEIHYVWKEVGPIATDLMPIASTTSFANCPKDLDVLFVPGGIMGTIACMNDPEVLGFLADRGSRAKWVTSVCTGSLVLGAAGLLRGYKATSNWTVTDILPVMGAIYTPGRVITDRNRITGAAVTAGIDFGLTLAAKLRDEHTAKRAQLLIEYAPEPPFDAGTPERAGPELVREIKSTRVGMEAMARQAAEAAARGFPRA